MYRGGVERPYKARVAHVGMECDLAVLRVEDQGFWSGLQPLELGSLPHVQQQVQVSSAARWAPCLGTETSPAVGLLRYAWCACKA